MDRPNTAACEHRDIDFAAHDVVRIGLINPSSGDLSAACKLLGSPSKRPLTQPDITVRFVDELVCKSGIGSVPLRMPIVGLPALKKVHSRTRFRHSAWRGPVIGRLGSLWKDCRAPGVCFKRSGVCRGRMGATERRRPTNVWAHEASRSSAFGHLWKQDLLRRCSSSQSISIYQSRTAHF